MLVCILYVCIYIYRYELSIQAYMDGLELDHSNCEILANLGSLYRDLGKFEDSKEAFERCINSRLKSSYNGMDITIKGTLDIDNDDIYISPPPPAIFNNYGLLELESFANIKHANELFHEAKRIMYKYNMMNGHDIILRNIERSNELLSKHVH